MSCQQVLSSGRKIKVLLLLFVFIISLCLPALVLARPPQPDNPTPPPPPPPTGDPIGGNKNPLFGHIGDPGGPVPHQQMMVSKVVIPQVPEVSVTLAVPCLGFLMDVAPLIERSRSETEVRSQTKGS